MSLPGVAGAASPVYPLTGATITDTHTPTFVLQLDGTPQADGQPAESNALIVVDGPRVGGGSGPVAFCTAQSQTNGDWSCADTSASLPNGFYLWTFTYWLHTCGPAIGPYPPNCTTITVPGTGGTFTIGDPTPSTSPPPPTTTPDVQTPTTIPSENTPPGVEALPARFALGMTGRLLFRASDPSGETGLSLGVFSGKRELWRKTLRNVIVQARKTYYVTWRPGHLGTYTFCVLAKDAAGNQSKASCARVIVS